MFDETIVVKSALSAFNNAAVAAPFFLIAGLLMLPLFFMVRRYGADFIATQSWWHGLRDVKNRASNFGLCILVTVFAWLVLMGGNYGVLRDAASTLPYAVSVMLFGLCAVIVWNLRRINPALPAFAARSPRRKRLFLVGATGLVAVAAGIGGVHTWWGFLMPAAAVFCGVLVGRALRRVPDAVMFSTLVMFAVATLLLMQPEFFRFGQLGALTLAHLAALGLCGVSAAAVVALRFVRARGKIHHSAYIKLKWMARFVVALGFVLFVLTESVPVFLGTTAAMTLSFAMSVWHAKAVPDDIGDKMWAALMCVFGIITIMPVITALGIIYWGDGTLRDAWRRSRFLL